MRETSLKLRFSTNAQVSLLQPLSFPNTNHQTLSSECGRTLQENSGTFTYSSSNSPVEMQRCEWRITATNGERIVLKLTELEIPKSTDCIEVRDGYWHKSPILRRICDVSTLENMITSSGSRMLVSYVSKKTSEHRRFTASYEGKLKIPNRVMRAVFATRI